MCDANNEKKYLNVSYHLVLICDEGGIFDTFKEIKHNLAENNKVFLSLIYVVPSNLLNPLFERELRILGQRFPQKLIKHKLKIEPGEYELIQESIEAVINSNTNLNIRFSVSGNPEFVDYVCGVLGYLSVETHYIEYKII